MKTFFKAHIASLSASFCDYLITVFLIKFLYADSLLGSVLGTVFGGIINFLIGRYWVFKTHNGHIGLQGKRYFLGWTGNLILNVICLYLLIELLTVQYMVAKIATSFFVAFAYNYPIQKKYVFKNN